MTKRKTVFLVYSFTLSIIIIWIALIFLAPYLKSRSSSLNLLIYAACSSVCHQIPSRSLHVFGYPLAVCARCLGIYLGFLGGTGAFPLVRGFSNLSLPKTKSFILLSLPMIIDAAGNTFQLWRSPHWLRLITGLLWGFILPFYFIVGLTDFFLRLRKHKNLRL